MKKLQILLALFVLCTTGAYSQGHFKIRSDEFIHVGYGTQKSITFGNQSTYSPDNGLYAIEAWSGGLNFWKPWPNAQGYGNYILFLRSDKNVGIGTSGSTSYKLDVNGNIRATGWVSQSDSSLKSNVLPITYGLSTIMSLHPVSYQYNFKLNPYDGMELENLSETKQKTIEGDVFVSDNSTHLGLIAQDVKEILPDIVKEDEDGMLGINYTELIPVLINAIQEQQKQIEALKIEVEELKKD